MTDTLMKSIRNGYSDRGTDGLLWKEQLYRFGPLQRFGWRVGWVLAHMFGGKPLRTKRKP